MGARNRLPIFWTDSLQGLDARSGMRKAGSIKSNPNGEIPLSAVTLKSKIIVPVLAFAAIALVCWLRLRPSGEVRRVASQNPAPPATESNVPAATPEPPTVELPVGRMSELADSSFPTTLRLQTGRLPWEMEIDGILGKDMSDPVKVTELFRLLLKLPPEAWERITEEALKRVPDERYHAEALPRLINPQTNGRVLSVLFADLMDRPETISLPGLAAIARVSGHPYAEAARENLQHALNADLASDWAAWDAAIRRHLAASPGR